MTRANRAFAVLIVASLGLWGCAKGPANTYGSIDKIKNLEAKIVRVEEDFRAAAEVRDQLKNRLTALDEHRALLQKQLDENRKNLTARTTERDNMQNQFEQFRKEIRNILGQAEAAANSVSPHITAASLTSNPKQS